MAEVASLVLEVKTRGVKPATDDLDRLKKKSGETAGAVGKMGVAAKASAKATALALAAIASAARGLGATIRIASEYEASLSKLSAVSKASAKDMQAMSKVAKELGRTTAFSASQAAEGMTFLAMAGFDAKEAIEAIPSALDLAAVAGIGLGQAADIASNVMSGFGLAANEAARAADVLTAASTSANTNVSQLGEAMKYVGPVAQSVGISIENAAAAVGVLSDAGIQGSMAGTSLRTAIAALINPTDDAADALAGIGLTMDDVNPATKDLTQIFKTFKDAGLGAAEAIRIFGTEGGPAALALTQAGSRIGELTKELEGAKGAAADTSKIMRDNLIGDLKGLRSATEGLAIALGEMGLLAVLRAAVQTVTLLVRGITSLVDAFNFAVDWIVRAANGTRAFEQATEASRMALELEVAAAKALAAPAAKLAEISLESAAAKLGEAQATRANILALQQENAEKIKQALGWNENAIEIERTRKELEELSTVMLRATETGKDLTGYMQDAAARAAEVELAHQRLAEALREQQRILQAARDQRFASPEDVEALETLDRLIASLTKTLDGTAGKTAATAKAVEELTAAASAAFLGDAPFSVDTVKALNTELDLLGSRLAMLGQAVKLDEAKKQMDALVSGLILFVDKLGIAEKAGVGLGNAIAEYYKAANFEEQAVALMNMAESIADAAGGADKLTGGARAAYLQLLQAAMAAKATSENVESIAANVNLARVAMLGLKSALTQVLSTIHKIVAGANTFAAAIGRLGTAVGGLGGIVGTVIATAQRLPVFGKQIADSVTPALRGAWREAKTLGNELWEAAQKGQTLAEFSDEKFGGGGAGKGSKGSMTRGLEEVKTAAQKLGEELGGKVVNAVQSLERAFSDFIYSGFKDFKGFIKNILNSFRRMFADMVAIALRNKIVVPIMAQITGVSMGALSGGTMGGGLPGIGTGAGALGQVASVGNAANMLTSLPFGIGGFFGGVGAGASAALGMGGYASAGLFNIGANAATAAAATGASAFAATVGAILPPLLAVTAIFSLFKTRTKELDKGLQITVNGFDGLVEQFQILEKKKLFSKKIVENITELEAEAAGPLLKAIADIQTAISTTAASLQIGAEAFDNFAYTSRISTKDLSEEEAQAAIMEEIQGLTDAFAEMIPGLTDLSVEGEGAATTLQRIVVTLNTVNQSLVLFENAALDLSMAGAAAANDLVNMMGGLDSFTNQVGAFFQTMLTEAQQTERMQLLAYQQLEDVKDALADMGLTLPRTHAAFVAMVEAQDLMTESGRAAYSALMSVSGAFTTLYGTAQEMATAQAAYYAEVGDPALDQEVRIKQAALDAANASVAGTAKALQQAQADLSQARAETARAESELRSAFSRERQRISTDAANQIRDARNAARAAADAIREEIDGLSDERDVLRERQSLYERIVGALEDAYTSRRVLTAIQRSMAIADATAFLRSAVAGGGTDDYLGLRQAIDAVADPSTQLYDSFADYQQDFNVNTNLIRALRDLSGDALSIEEQMLSALEEQIRLLEDQSDQITGAGLDATILAIETARDQQLAKLDKQIEATLGVQGGNLSIAEAIDNLARAQGAEASAQRAVGSAQGAYNTAVAQQQDAAQQLADAQAAAEETRVILEPGSPLWYAKYRPGTIYGQMNAIYNRQLGRNVDEDGMLFWVGHVEKGNLTLAEAEDLIANSPEAKGTGPAGIPAFARGGRHRGGMRIVGERGPEMEFTGPSEIVSNSATRRMMRESREMADAMIESNERMRYLQDKLREQTRVFKDWDVNGQPGFRDETGDILVV